MDMTMGTLLAALIAFKLAEHAIAYFWKKFTKDEKFMTPDDCEKLRGGCSKHNADLNDGIREELGIVKGILLVVAVKMGIPENQWQRLTK